MFSFCRNGLMFTFTVLRMVRMLMLACVLFVMQMLLVLVQVLLFGVSVPVLLDFPGIS